MHDRLYIHKSKYFVSLSIACVIGLLAQGCTMTTSRPSSQDSTMIQVPAPVAVGNRTLYWRTDIKPIVLQMIQQSRRVCHLSMYELGDLDVLQALSVAYKRGVDVKLILDATESHTRTVAVPYLKKMGIPFYLLPIRGGISHIKSLVTDDAGSSTLYNEVMGGMNFGPKSWNNLDASVLLTGTTRDFEDLFQHDWAKASGFPATDIHSNLFYYDRQIDPAMERTIGQAHTSIEIMAFNLSDSQMIQQLMLAAARGVQIRILMEPTEKQNQKTAKQLKQAGIDVHFYQHVDQEILHAKLISIDNGAYVWVGSANFSHQAFQNNHEGDLLFQNVTAFAKTIHECLETEWKR